MEALETFRFPFLGTREDGDSFEYLLMDIDQEKVNIGIFKWMVNHTNLELNEKINLFIPVKLTSVYQFRHEGAGVVKSIKIEEEGHAHFYEVYFKKEFPLDLSSNEYKAFVEVLSSDSSLNELLIQLIKDSIILKQGILVYLKHLYPYFSRIVDYSHKDFQSLHFIFDDLNNKIKSNEEILISLYETLLKMKDPQEIPIIINLEYLRENMEPEISLDLFLFAFGKPDAYKEFALLLKESRYELKHKPDYYFMNYLIVIKNLEKRLYSNYNQIVLIYLKFI